MPAAPALPSLLLLTADRLAAAPHLLTSEALLSVGEMLTALLLSRVVKRGALTYAIARAFLETRYEMVIDALSSLDLLAGIAPPLTEMTDARRRPCQP